MQWVSNLVPRENAFLVHPAAQSAMNTLMKQPLARYIDGLEGRFVGRFAYPARSSFLGPGVGMNSVPLIPCRMQQLLQRGLTSLQLDFLGWNPL